MSFSHMFHIVAFPSCQIFAQLTFHASLFMNTSNMAVENRPGAESWLAMWTSVFSANDRLVNSWLSFSQVFFTWFRDAGAECAAATDNCAYIACCTLFHFLRCVCKLVSLHAISCDSLDFLLLHDKLDSFPLLCETFSCALSYRNRWKIAYHSLRLDTHIFFRLCAEIECDPPIDFY